jgi:hypothetical protein
MAINTTAADYRRKAERARQNAALTDKEEFRRKWTALAETYTRLAEAADAREKRRRRAEPPGSG